jgi:hypothetical protein
LLKKNYRYYIEKKKTAPPNEEKQKGMSSSSKTPSISPASWKADGPLNMAITVGMFVAAGLVLYLIYTIFLMRPAASDAYIEAFSLYENKKPEKGLYSLIPQNKLAVYLGTGSVPTGQARVAPPEDPAEPGVSVSGALGGPKSAFLFKYNKASPSCCLQGPYSTIGGCPCLTDDQKAMLRNGGSI